MGLGRFFHKEEPIYNKVIYPISVLQKGCLSLAKPFFVSILQCRTNLKISFRYKRTVVIVGELFLSQATNILV